MTETSNQGPRQTETLPISLQDRPMQGTDGIGPRPTADQSVNNGTAGAVRPPEEGIAQSARMTAGGARVRTTENR